MAWQNEMTILVQHLVNDLDESTLSTQRLEQTIVVAAQLLLNELNFDKDYTINVDACEITPDPTSDTKDNAFIQLVSMQAAVIVAQGEARTFMRDAIRFEDGPSRIWAEERAQQARELFKTLNEDLKTAKKQFHANGNLGKAIVSGTNRQRFEGIQGNFR